MRHDDRDVSMQGQCVFTLGTEGPRKFVQGHIVAGCPITPPVNSSFIVTKKWANLD